LALGGPHSVRGYNIGELGATMNLFEESSINPVGNLKFFHSYDASFSILIAESVYGFLLICFVLIINAGCH
jgi:outer membrane protein assembly factor BamA